jgi:hypothetical protein
LQTSRALDAELKIVTDEGDTVTLSLGTETDVSLATYSGQVRGNGGKERLRANFLRVSSRNDVNVQVDGDLNQQERADIDRLLSRVGRALRSFLRNHVGAAIHQLLSIGNLGSLAGFDLKATRTEKTTTAWWKKLIS